MKAVRWNAPGFTLLELIVAMGIGLIVIMAAAQLFQSGVNTTAMVTEQSEMQQNVRSAVNLIAKDVSMAGSGLPSGGVSLPYGTGSSASKYGCNQTPTCYLTADTYPSGVVGTTTVSNYMYGLIPGPSDGMEAGGAAKVPATQKGADSITVLYIDYSYPLNQYSVAFGSKGKSLTFTPPSSPPAGFPAIVSPTGLVVGDLLLLSNNVGSAVAEVTGLTATSGGGANVTLANSDALNINQSGAANGNVAYISGGTPTIAYRLYAISYFLEVPTNGQTPRLMRQVSGQTPIPVADNIISLNFTYDTCDNSGVTPCAAISDPIGSGFSPNQIHKVNITVMGQAVLAAAGKSESMALTTSVSTRSLSFKNRYN
jgi:prepilin-type N-terminal cleavage/methylation domain-containing protein